jgi:hypothetical protein
VQWDVSLLAPSRTGWDFNALQLAPSGSLNIGRPSLRGTAVDWRRSCGERSPLEVVYSLYLPVGREGDAMLWRHEQTVWYILHIQIRLPARAKLCSNCARRVVLGKRDAGCRLWKSSSLEIRQSVCLRVPSALPSTFTPCLSSYPGSQPSCRPPPPPLPRWRRKTRLPLRLHARQGRTQCPRLDFELDFLLVIFGQDALGAVESQDERFGWAGEERTVVSAYAS